jgi:hypothetical protein
MRTRRCAVSALFVCLVAGAACGGSESNSSGAKSGQTSESASAQPASRASSGSSEAATTTTALGDAGSPGTKLVESQPPAAGNASATPATGASSPSPGRGGRSHEPGRSVADIRAIIIAHRDEARACYDQALADHPGIEGDLVIDWTIDPKGNVSRISLDTARSQITDAAAMSCVVGIIKKIQFAPSPGGYETRASYPFNFHPRHTSETTTP